MDIEINIGQIYEICAAVKNAITAIGSETLLLKNFPHGCCRDTSLILALILTSKGYESIIYCSKENDSSMPSHAWLKYKNYFLDLTADQFDSQYNHLVIDEANAPCQMYRIDNQEKPSLEIAGLDAPALLSDYNIVIRHLDEFQLNR